MPWTARPGLAVAIFPFAADGKFQVSLNVGDEVELIEENSGWAKGTVLSSNRKGIFPVNHVKAISGKGEGPAVLAELKKAKSVAHFADPLVNEIALVLREWHVMMRGYFEAKRYAEFNLVKDRMRLLMDWRRDILDPNVPEDQKQRIKQKVISKIEEGRRTMGLDMIPRTDAGEPADERNTSVVSLYRMHVDMEQREREPAGRPGPTPSSGSGRIGKSKIGGAEVATGPDMHIFMDMKACICSCGSDTELYFTICKHENKALKPITEPYQVSLTEFGMPHDVEKIGKLKTIFKDFTPKELADDLYLVCRMLRRGKIVHDDDAGQAPSSLAAHKNKDKKTVDFRRPFGYSALRLTAEVLSGSSEQMMPINAPPTEAQYPTLADNIVNRVSNYDVVPRSKGICVALRVLQGDFARIVDETEELKDLASTNKLDFPEVILPGENRNDLYITLESGEFLQDRKKSAKNVEVIVQVMTDTGEIVPNCISAGAGAHLESEYRSTVYYHMNNPRFGMEQIRLNLPVDAFERSHLLFSFRHCSSNESKSEKEKPFSFAFAPITNPDGTVLANQTHTVVTYKPWPSNQPPSYLTEAGAAKLQLRKSEHLSFRTHLCSTIKTQNVSLLALIKWRTSNDNLEETLRKFTFIEQVEIIKFLREIFDALFAIMEDKNTQDVDLLVYDSIVYIVGILVDDRTAKFKNFRPVLDKYIETHFKSTVAHRGMLSALSKILGQASDPRAAGKIRSSMKALEFLIKFIVASRLKHDIQTAQSPQLDTQFKQDLLAVFSMINDIMARTEPDAIIGAQTIALRVFSSISKDLATFFDDNELIGITCRFIESVKDDNTKLVAEKLSLLHNIVRSDVFLRPESRQLFIPTLIQQLEKHILASESELHLCVPILVDMLEGMQSRGLHPGESLKALLPLLPTIFEGILSMDVESPTRSQLNTCALAMLLLMDEAMYAHFWSTLSGPQIKRVLCNMLCTCQTFLSMHTFPEHWLILCMFEYSVILKVFTLARDPICAHFLKTFDADVWEEYIKLGVAVIFARNLQLERFSSAKQGQLVDRYGDIRLETVKILRGMWEQLGQHQVRFIKDMVGPSLEMIRLDNESLRHVGIEVYFKMIEREFNETQKFVVVEQSTIDTLDVIANEKNAETFSDFFTSNLERLFRDSSLGGLQTQSATFLKDIKQLLELMSALRGYPMDLEFEDERGLAILKLMAYLKQTERRDAYIKYAHKLAALHMHNQNYAEAANTLMLHADLLEWSDKTEAAIEPDTRLEFPQQTQAQRKESLYRHAIEFYDSAKLWERAITLITELRHQYEHVQYNYALLSDILATEARMFLTIAEHERFYAEYFRVAYYGNGFPEDYRSKEFVYRGYELEKLAEFVGRIQSKFRNAEILQSSTTPSAEIINGDGQYVQINTVYPSSMEEAEGKDPPALNPRMPPRVRKYHRMNGVKVFSYSRPFRKSKEKSDNEFKDLWIVNSYLVTQDPFPTIQRRSPVTKTIEIELSPIENALKSVKAKNDEMEAMARAIEKQESEAKLSPFTMALNGVIDAAVNGGVYKYRDAFFTDAYASANPDKANLVQSLREELRRQLNVCQRGLVTHREHCPDEMMALQDKMETVFEKMKADLKADVL